MKIDLLFLYTFIWLFANSAFSLAQNSDLKFWNMRYLNGSVTLSGEYFNQSFTRKLGGVQELKSSLWRGIFELRSENYIFHQNFILINFDASLRPGTRKDEYIVIPERTVNTTSEKINTSIFIFKERPYNASFSAGFDHSFTNRDFSSNIENYRTTFESNFNLYSKVLPVKLKYNYEKWEQNELSSNERYSSTDNNFILTTNKMLFDNLNNQLNISYRALGRKYSFITSPSISKEFNFSLNSSMVVKAPLNISFNSLISYFDRGGFEASTNFQLYENLVFQLPKNFKISANVNFVNSKYANLASRRFTMNLSISHQLYQSLYTYGKLSFSNSVVNSGIEKISGGDVGFNYTKKIPTGTFYMSYNYNRESKSNEDDLFNRAFINEMHILNDNDIVFLLQANIDLNSVVVKSDDGLIVYRESVDYYLIQKDIFVEIRRVFGGAIANGENVLVNYIAKADPNYSYEMTNSNFSAGISLFKNLIKLSYVNNSVSFPDVSNTKSLSLREINRSLYEGSINYKGLSLGVEFDEYQSNIIPYRSEKVFFRYSYFEEKSLITSLTINSRKFLYLEDREEQKFYEAVGKIGLFLGLYSKINLEGSLRYQEGLGIDLKFGTGKIEYQTLYRAIYFTIGLEYLRQNYIGEKQRYFTGYFKIKRNF